MVNQEERYKNRKLNRYKWLNIAFQIPNSILLILPNTLQPCVYVVLQLFRLQC